MHVSAHCLYNLYWFFKMRKPRNSGIPLDSHAGDVDVFAHGGNGHSFRGAIIKNR